MARFRKLSKWLYVNTCVFFKNHLSFHDPFKTLFCFHQSGTQDTFSSAQGLYYFSCNETEIQSSEFQQKMFLTT